MRFNILPILVLLLLCSCFENSYLEEIPEIELEDNFTIKRIIHTDIELATVYLDTLITSGKTSLLLGSYQDPYRGKISISPFFEFTPGISISRFEDEKELDSMVFVMKYSETHYDTLPEFGLKIWEITEDFEYKNDQDVFYQFESLSTGRSPILNTKIRIFPSQDSLRITLPYAYASAFFEKCKGYTSILASESDFKSAFHGFKLEAENNSPIIRFSTDSHLMIYYQTRNEANRESEEYKIPIGETSKSFLNIQKSYTQSLFDGSQIKTLIPSNQTAGTVLADQLGSAAFVLKVGDMTDYGAIPSQYYIAEANLYLPVKKGTYDHRFNPSATSLDIYSKVTIGGFTTYLTQGTLTSLDEQFQEATYFKIPITEYVNAKIRGLDTSSFLWLELASSEDFTIPYLVIGTNSSTYQPKIEITILPLNQQL